jgi:anti-sigma B factor antagonist
MGHGGEILGGRAEVMRWSVVTADDDVTVAIDGELDLANSASLGAALADVVDARPRRITLDLAHLSFLDSSGVHCLLDAANRAAANGCDLGVRRPTGIVLRVLEICGVDTLLLDGSNKNGWEAR